jgi:hypothetical protein
MNDNAPIPARIAHLTTLVVFLMWMKKADPGAMWGGHKIDEVIEALSVLSGLSIAQMAKVAYGEEQT